MPKHERKTGKVTFNRLRYEVELEPHHHSQTYERCKQDCPDGWKIPLCWLLQSIYDSPQRGAFNLNNTSEYTDNRDTEGMNRVTWFSSCEGSASTHMLYTHPSDTHPERGVRYAREITDTAVR